MEYGTGAIMAVPAHDERDFEFARKYGLEIVRVLAREGESAAHAGRRGGAGRGRPPAGEFGPIRRPAGRAGQAGHHRLAGSRTDRARGECNTGCMTGASPGSATGVRRSRSSTATACGPVPVPEKDLPVLLPPIEDFRPDDSGVSPLARHGEWYYVACPSCGKKGRRETDVSDTFLDSSWYFLRYPSTEFADRPFDPARTRTWCPVTTYIGGNEHAVLHLLYSRFMTMVLHDLGHLQFDGAVRPVPGSWPDREGRGQDVEDQGQHRGAGPVHLPVGSRHFPDVPHVPGTVPGRWRLPRRRHQRTAPVPRPGLGVWWAVPRSKRSCPGIWLPAGIGPSGR